MLRLSVVTLSTSTLVAVSGLVFPSTFPRRLRPASATHRTSPPGGSGDNLSAPDTLDGEACDPLDAFPPPECTDSPGLDTWVRADDESVDYFGQSKRGDLVRIGLGVPPLCDDDEEISIDEADECLTPLVIDSDADIDRLCEEKGLPSALKTPYPFSDPTKGVFCSRTLNLRSIQVIGYDMDYTLVRYRVDAWEERAYHYAKEWLRAKGFWVSGLNFEADKVVRGLIVDKELGNLVKVDRFGYVREAMHGTRPLDQVELQRLYGRSVVDLRNRRWSFLNTLFSVSEATLYLQMVDRLDDGGLLANSSPPFEPAKCDSYEKLYQAASKSVFRAHVTSKLKSEVLANPAKFIELDDCLVRTLVDQRLAGKKLALITNSDWPYTDTIMRYLVGHHPQSQEAMQDANPLHTDGDSDATSSKQHVLLNQEKWGAPPPLPHWRSLFDVVVVSARKPDFFTSKMPVYEVVSAWPQVPPLDGLGPSLVPEMDQLRASGITADDNDEENNLSDSAYAQRSNNNNEDDDEEDDDDDEFTTEKVLIPDTKEDWNAAEAPSLAAAPPASTGTGGSSSGKSARSSNNNDGSNNQKQGAGDVTTALLQEVFGMSLGRVYQGGTASMVEKLFNVTSTDRILYVGDHVFTDVSIAKASNRWRTLLVLQELEDEVRGLAQSHGIRAELKALLSRKDRLADILNHLRTSSRRQSMVSSPSTSPSSGNEGAANANTPPPQADAELMQQILGALEGLDRDIEARLKLYGANVNTHWGYMSRAGFSDKSHLMRQIEKYADVYTSRVSNLLRYTPYAYFRAGQQSLAHDGDDLSFFLDGYPEAPFLSASTTSAEAAPTAEAAAAAAAALAADTTKEAADKKAESR